MNMKNQKKKFEKSFLPTHTNNQIHAKTLFDEFSALKFHFSDLKLYFFIKKWIWKIKKKKLEISFSTNSHN